MNTVEYINEGYDKAVTREELMRLTGLSDRKVRLDINEAVKRGEIIINLGYGYFKPIPNKEDHLAKEYLMKERSRAKDEMRKIKMLERYLGE